MQSIGEAAAKADRYPEAAVEAVPPPARHDSAWTRYRSRILALAALVVVGLCVYALSEVLADVSYDDLAADIAATPPADIALAFLFTAVSFAALSVYDHQALAFIGRRLPYPIVALTSFCAYAVGNVAGFGPLTGGTIRYRFYSRFGVPPEDIARIVGYVTAAFGIGLLFVAALGILWSDHGVSGLFGLKPIVTRTFAVVALAGIGALVIAAATAPRELTVLGRRIRIPTLPSILVQLAATLVDVVASATVLWVLLPSGPVTYPVFVGVYAVAVGLGILSHLPGGIGVFETVILGTVGTQVSPSAVVGALVLYRLIYYVAPLLVAVLVVTVTELRRTALENPVLVRALDAVLPLLVGALTVVLGAMLVFSGVTPAPDARLAWLQNSLPLPLVEGAHFIASVLGLFMILAARGLVHRLDGAWWLAAVLTAISIPLALIKALAIGESLLLGVLLLTLLLSRRLFDRPASLIHDRLSAGWWLCVGTVLALAAAMLFFAYKEVEYSHELWWQFAFEAEAPRSLRAAFGIGIAAAGTAIWLLTRPPPGKIVPPSAAELAKAVEITGAQAVADANLVRMGDKSLLFSTDGSAFLMYGKRGRSWISLFGPIGAEEAWPELVWRFVETARLHGGRAAFYQVPAEMLGLYADAGLSAFKLGEEAKIQLSNFDLKGSRRASIRNSVNRFDREGIVFEVVPASGVCAVMGELKRVSDLWVAEHRVREKGFSLGAFDRAYLEAQPVAMLKRGDRVLAFANLMTGGLMQESTVDLMRFDPEAPNGSMEVLFAKIMLHFKSEGYAWFSLGMAPLAGLSDNPVAPLWHRLGRAAFDHGEALYNFHGLRAFKNKFHPEWRPRYMAVAGGINPVLALADATVLISGGSFRGVIAQ